MDEEKLSNPFDKKSDDFLSFQASTPQSSPAPRGRGFMRQRGHSTVQGNWNRFEGDIRRHEGPAGGAHSAPRTGFGPPSTPGSYFYSQQKPPRFRGNNYSPNSSYGRGVSPHRGNFSMGHSPNYRGNFRGNHWRSNRSPFGGRGGHNRNPDDPESYVHPSMLEDPWAELERKKNVQYSGAKQENSSDDEAESKKLSESLIPQVGDSFFERNVVDPAPDISMSSSYSLADDSGVLPSDEQAVAGAVGSAAVTVGEGKVGLSDSLVPLVGDSLLGDGGEDGDGDSDDEEEKGEESIQAT